MHGYTLLLHGEGHEVCMQITTYINEGSPEEVTDSDFYEKQYLEEAITYIRFKIKE
jgi:hypothetical protein